MVNNFLLVGLGGSLGAMARYSIYLLEKSYLTHAFPYGTLLINATGCFLSGLLLTFVEQNDATHRGLLLFLIVGFLGSFTTFSAFSVDNYQLLRTGQLPMAFMNMGLNIILGMVFAWFGHKVYN